MTALLTLLLLTAPPATAQDVRTDWMRPDAFHLAIGMSRMQVMSVLAPWSPKRGKNDDEVIVDYAEDKSMTLEFRNERLSAIRFELFVMLPVIRKAFEDVRVSLLRDRGEPRKATKSILIYDNALPSVIVVVSDDPKSEQGKRGLGVLAARYYDPR